MRIQIVTILLFNLIFNIGGCVCLWIHNAPQFPGGYSRAILAAAVMSSISAGYNLCVVLLFCCQYPVATQETVPAKAAGGISPAAIKQEEGRKPRVYERKETKKDEVKGHSGVVPVMEGSAGSAPPLPPPPPAPPAASSVDRTQPTNREIEPEGGESRQKFGQELGSKERDIIAVTDHRSAGDVKTAIEILDRPAIAN
ncbi:hypothetical protein ANCCAN_02753 [Ancylostoma caninum]|uniref:Uncharacterized protein n=1 Tax=Ancylostoma caninum TaxID=29170 RepID=A0A368H3K5_ANCCA|nr:hypothetical protein ANCCAN_02753 [Ancylostoma caninum]